MILYHYEANFLFTIINYSFLTSWSIFHGKGLLVTLSKVLQHFTNFKKPASDRLRPYQ